jgi:heat shock protein HslJ
LIRILCIPPLVVLTIVAATAQEKPPGFPLGRSFKVISISGFDVQRAGMTFAVAPEPQSNRLIGSGSAGCNSWTAGVVLREDQIDITNIVTTRKMCPKPRMTSEEAFLTTLKSAQRWRIDDKNRLILEGEAARLLLTAGGADRQPEKKSDKKSAKKPAPKPAAR